MKSRALVCAILCLASYARVASQEERKQLIVPLERAGFVSFRIEAVPANSQGASKVTPAAESLVTPQVQLDAQHVIHRVLTDSDGDFVFGYDLVVEPLAGEKQFKVTVRPLGQEFENQLRTEKAKASARLRSSISISTLPGSTEAQTIDDGDAFALDLLVNPRTGVKIVDLVQVSFDRAKLWEAPEPTAPARDFTLANVELAVRDYRLLMNGELVGGGKPTRGCEGALVWFYVPGKGRFIFSLIPHPGYDFQKIGIIEDNKISFMLGGDHYEWISGAPVVGNGGNWNLWVLQDEGYIPIPEFYPPAQAARNDGVIKQTVVSTPFIGPWLESVLSQSRKAKAQSEHETHSPSPKPSNLPARVRVTIGAADRIENLWPK